MFSYVNSHSKSQQSSDIIFSLWSLVYEAKCALSWNLILNKLKCLKVTFCFLCYEGIWRVLEQISFSEKYLSHLLKMISWEQGACSRATQEFGSESLLQLLEKINTFKFIFPLLDYRWCEPCSNEPSLTVTLRSLSRRNMPYHIVHECKPCGSHAGSFNGAVKQKLSR